MRYLYTIGARLRTVFHRFSVSEWGREFSFRLQRYCFLRNYANKTSKKSKISVILMKLTVPSLGLLSVLSRFEVSVMSALSIVYLSYIYRVSIVYLSCLFRQWSRIYPRIEQKLPDMTFDKNGKKCEEE